MKARRALPAVPALLAWALTAVGSTSAQVAPVPPPLPPQPAAGSSSHCTAQPSGRPGTWTRVAQDDGSTAYSPDQLVADPWFACRLYRARDTQSVERSLDGGRNWTMVFRDGARGTLVGTSDATCAPPLSACLASTPEFTASGLVSPVAASGTVMLSETANGDALISSADGGSTWQLNNGGSGGIAGAAVVRVLVAPSNAAVAYAVVAGPGGVGGASGLYVTTDGGAQWTPAVLPPAADRVLTSLQVDPTDPSILWAVAHQTATNWAVVRATNYGQLWAVSGQPTVAGPVVQLLVTSTPRHPLRMFLTGLAGSDAGVAYSDDGGLDFSYPRLGPTLVNPTVAADPTRPGTMVLVGTETRSDGPRVVSYFSRDGFDTGEAGPPAPVVGRLGLASPYTRAAPPDAMVEAVRGGWFYVAVQTDCTVHPLPLGCAGTPTLRQSWWRLTSPFTTAATPGAGQDTAPVPTPQPPPGGGASTGTPLVELAHCYMPGYTGRGSLSGTLAYDGRDLLYTQSGDSGPDPDEGLIHRIDPVTCADRGVIVVRFSADELADLARTEHYDNGAHPGVAGMTYDPSRNVIWASVYTTAISPFYGSNQSTLFEITAPDLTLPVVMADARLSTLHRGCGQLLSYDLAHDSLWTCDPEEMTDPWGHRISAVDGRRLPSCGINAGGAYDSNGMATWTVVGHNRLYVQSEDDTTTTAYDTESCAQLATYVHRTFAEPTGEDEQMTCDSVSFGPDSASPLRTSVLWLRDATAQLVTAYAIPDRCPLPTVTRLAAPAAVAAGSDATLCATLAVRGLGSVLAGRTLAFAVDGHAVGSALTGMDGRTCVVAGAVPAGVHRIDVRFGGDAAYLESEDRGALLAVGPSLHTGAPPVAVPLPGPPPPAQLPGPAAQGPAPQPAAQAQAQSQVQTQAQTEAQVNTQTVAQTQPGVMRQRQERAEVAVQAAPNRRTDLAFQAVRSRRDARTAASATGGGALLLMLSLLPRARALMTVRVGCRRPRSGDARRS